MRGPFVRKRSGGLDVTLTEPEVDLLRSVVRQLTDVLVAPDQLPFTKRLFPPAYENDAEAQTEFASMMSSDLLDGKRRAVAAVQGSLDRGGLKRGAWRVSLSGDEADDWLAVVNDARLTIGTKLEVTEETYERDIPPDDPDAIAHEVFRYLGWLEENLVATMMG